MSKAFWCTLALENPSIYYYKQTSLNKTGENKTFQQCVLLVKNGLNSKIQFFLTVVYPNTLR